MNPGRFTRDLDPTYAESWITWAPAGRLALKLVPHGAKHDFSAQPGKNAHGAHRDPGPVIESQSASV